MAYTGSKAQSGLGSILAIGGITGATGTEVFAPIGELSDIPFKRGDWKMEATTNLQSTIEEQIPTIPGLTTISLKGNRVPNDAGQIVVETAFNAVPALPYDFKLTLPVNLKAGQTTTGDVFTWSAYVKSSDFDISGDKVIPFMVDIVLNTRPVRVAGS